VAPRRAEDYGNFGTTSTLMTSAAKGANENEALYAAPKRYATEDRITTKVELP